MTKLTASSAAFHGFGLIRRDPLAFLGVALLMTAYSAYLAVAILPAYAELMELSLSGVADPETLTAASMSMAGAGGLAGLLILPLYAAILGAINRSLVFGASQGWLLGLKLGMDELRVVLVTIVGYILTFLPYFGVALAGFVLATGMAAGVAAAGGGDAAAGVAVLLIIPVYFLALGVMIWVGIRLSFAGPASVGEGRFVIFESWSMTKGRFWTLFLAYLLQFVIVFVAYLVVGIIVAAVFGASMVAAGQQEFTGVPSVSVGPAQAVIGGFVYAVIVTFFTCGFLGVAARGYVDWKDAQGSTIADHF